MTAIDDFLATKSLASNSVAAYRYDLEQFRQIVAGTIDQTSLRDYQLFLSSLKPTAQKRKRSAVNQFLYFLYEQGHLNQFHKLSIQSPVETPAAKTLKILDLSALWEVDEDRYGQLLALFILSFGLQPNELLALKTSDIHVAFGAMTVIRGQEKRVLSLPQELLPYLSDLPKQVYLFGKRDKPYSRQWAFRRLSQFLTQKGFGTLSAQDLRDQYVLKALSEGKPLTVIAKDLGLKSTLTLEKYLSI